MKEVSNRSVLNVVEVCRRTGLPVSPLLAGLVPDSVLRDPGARIAWNDFAEFLDRVTTACGGLDALERRAEHLRQVPSTLTASRLRSQTLASSISLPTPSRGRRRFSMCASARRISRHSGFG